MAATRWKETPVYGRKTLSPGCGAVWAWGLWRGHIRTCQKDTSCRNAHASRLAPGSWRCSPLRCFLGPAGPFGVREHRRKPAARGGSLLGNLCEMEDIGWGGGKESFSCDLNDIAGLLSGVLDPVLNLTYLNRETNVVICRVDTDKAPDSTYAPGGGTRG
jgi:hypothetical protein